ncbi:hypothetical protein MASR2M78_15740 [Treponema sp.]
MTFDAQPYAQATKQRNEAERVQIAKRAVEATEEAKRLARAIKENDPDIKAVYLFGSLAQGTPSNLDFDIDLALDGGDTYKAMDISEESAFSVDLVQLNLVPAHLRKRILETGIELL